MKMLGRMGMIGMAVTLLLLSLSVGCGGDGGNLAPLGEPTVEQPSTLVQPSVIPETQLHCSLPLAQVGLRVSPLAITDVQHEPIAQYPLNTGEGSIAFDTVSHYDGSINNGTWISFL